MEKNYNTLEYYNKNAKQYCEQTLEGKLQENYDKFLKELPANSYILDFGCGSGRDSKHFIENGYKVKAIDGSIEMCKLASEYINQEVECMKFDELDDIDTYDEIWACASILHVEKENLPIILDKMIKALKINGIIYISFKIGKGYKIKEGKYYNYLNKEEMQENLGKVNANATLINYFETLPSTKRKAENIIWGNFIIKKLG
ncbi:MAG: class I SAM-dependent methyltransferase [Clostridia bacterium]|nr:class I SAM-dependent methyltransferase [Clostridia bacterium]